MRQDERYFARALCGHIRTTFIRLTTAREAKSKTVNFHSRLFAVSEISTSAGKTTFPRYDMRGVGRVYRSTRLLRGDKGSSSFAQVAAGYSVSEWLGCIPKVNSVLYSWQFNRLQRSWLLESKWANDGRNCILRSLDFRVVTSFKFEIDWCINVVKGPVLVCLSMFSSLFFSQQHSEHTWTFLPLQPFACLPIHLAHHKIIFLLVFLHERYMLPVFLKDIW